MSTIEFVRELPITEAGARQCLVRRGADFYVVSSVSVCGIPETLVFPGDAKGKVTDWLEVAGGRYMSREEAIAELAES